MLSHEVCAHCRGWSLQNERPLSINQYQNVVIDCIGNEFAFRSNLGNLSMARGSALRYVNCQLLQYEFPDTNQVYGTVHRITNSTFGMRSCRVRPARCLNLPGNANRTPVVYTYTTGTCPSAVFLDTAPQACQENRDRQLVLWCSSCSI